ncbi:unnamed protein product [Schistosoma bovis]|nr:unnamed protein product [Schistosoma bovis]
MFLSERKASHSRDTQGNIVGIDFSGDDGSDSTSKEWVYTRWAKIMFRTAAMISLASVSMNTPDTFKQVPVLMYITFILDLMVALLFTVEMISKMYIEGLFVPASSQKSLDCLSIHHDMFTMINLFKFFVIYQEFPLDFSLIMKLVGQISEMLFTKFALLVIRTIL